LRNAALFAAGIAVLPASAAAEPTQGAPAAPGAAPTAQQPASPPLSDPNLLQRIDALEHTVTNLQNQLFDVREQANQPPPKTTKVSTKGGLKVESEDGAFSFQVIGRVQADTAFYDQDSSKLGDGTQLRRARLGAQGKLFNDWEYKFEADFARDTAAGTVGVKDAYIRYTGFAPAEFTIGNFYEPFSLEMVTGERYVTFMERALPVTAFAPDRHLGVGAAYYGPNWSAAAGVFGKSVDDPAPAKEGDQQFDTAARVTYEPVIDKDRLVHFGVSGLYRNPSDQSVRFSTKPESNVTGARFVDTNITPSAASPGALTAVDHLFAVGGESALVYGPFSLQGEYIAVPVTQTELATCPSPTTPAPPAAVRQCPSVTLTGWYAQASYFLTGESRNYNPKAARFDRILPNKNLGDSGGWGAFELAARVSEIDLDDGDRFQKGSEQDYTLGLNWYVNPYIELMANYIWVRNNASALGNAANVLPGKSASYDDPQIFELRAQIDW
jgi:phosphate-selective porin OprO/OprP